MASPLRVLIVDDSALYRKIVRESLADVPGVEVIGAAHNGRSAIDKLSELRPDLMTLDVEMPELNGLGVLKELSDRKSPVGAIMCSSLTHGGATTTTEALRLGAFDFVLKPISDSYEVNRETLKRELIPKVLAFASSSQLRRSLNGAGANFTAPRPSAAPLDATTQTPPVTDGRRSPKPDVIVLGISTGGPAALNRLLPQLPADLPVPMLIVQHMPAVFTKSLADDLRRVSKLHVSEATNGETLKPGMVRVAPGGRQMKIQYSLAGPIVRVTDDAPERNCRPSVDYLFRSAAESYGGRCLGVIMTGMGDDGAEGCRMLRRCNAPIVAQDEATCVVYGMPRCVIEQKLATVVCPLDAIAETILRIVHGRTAALASK